MRLKYEGQDGLDQWLADMRALPGQGYDNLLWFSGKEGEGKSTLAFQILRALDATFDVDRCLFGIRAFLRGVGGVPKGRAVLGDELELNSRLGMHGPNVAFVQYLTECRGRLHHIGVCYPHEDIFDRAVRDLRVRFRVHVPRRGFFEVYDRQRYERRTRGGRVDVFYAWRKLTPGWSFEENSGPLWDAYGAKKDAHMVNRGAQLMEEAEARGGGGGSGLGFEPEDAAAFFRAKHLDRLAADAGAAGRAP